MFQQEIVERNKILQANAVGNLDKASPAVVSRLNHYPSHLWRRASETSFDGHRLL